MDWYTHTVHRSWTENGRQWKAALITALFTFPAGIELNISKIKYEVWILNSIRRKYLRNGIQTLDSGGGSGVGKFRRTMNRPSYQKPWSCPNNIFANQPNIIYSSKYVCKLSKCLIYYYVYNVCCKNRHIYRSGRELVGCSTGFFNGPPANTLQNAFFNNNVNSSIITMMRSSTSGSSCSCSGGGK